MARNWVLLGLGPIAFGVAFGLSFLSDRDFKRASFTGVATLSAAYAGGLAAVMQRHPAKHGEVDLQRHADLAGLVAPIDTLKAEVKEVLPLHTQLTDLKERIVAIEAACQESRVFQANHTFVQSEDISPTKQREVAIFWDYENIRSASQGTKAPLAESLINYSKSQGHPRRKMVYANWRREKSEYIAQILYGLGFETVHVSTGKQNSADVKLSVDCLETVTQYPTIEKFIIVTSDRDFVPLINTLKNTFKKEVILVGQIDQASHQLLLSADDFIDVKKLDSSEESETISYQDALECLVKNVAFAPSRGYNNTSFATIDRSMRADPDFYYRGVSSIRKDDGGAFRYFKDFIAAAQATGKIIVSEDKELSIAEPDSPATESEHSPPQDHGPPQDLSSITREQWRLLIDSIQQSIAEGEAISGLPPSYQRNYGLFWPIAKCVIQTKRNGQFSNHSHKRLAYAMNRLLAFGILIKHADNTFELRNNLSSQLDEYLNELVET